MPELICPFCEEAGETSFCRRSKIKYDPGRPIYEKGEQYWDEEGKSHDHISFVIRRLIECSKDHLFVWDHSNGSQCRLCNIEKKKTNTFTDLNEFDILRHTSPDVLKERQDWQKRYSPINIKKANHGTPQT